MEKTAGREDKRSRAATRTKRTCKTQLRNEQKTTGQRAGGIKPALCNQQTHSGNTRPSPPSLHSRYSDLTLLNLGKINILAILLMPEMSIRSSGINNYQVIHRRKHRSLGKEMSLVQDHVA